MLWGGGYSGVGMWDSEDFGGCKGRMHLVEVYPLHRCGLCHHGSPSGAPETDNLV